MALLKVNRIENYGAVDEYLRHHQLFRAKPSLQLFYIGAKVSIAAESDTNGTILVRMAYASLGNRLNNTGLLIPLLTTSSPLINQTQVSHTSYAYN